MQRISKLSEAKNNISYVYSHKGKDYIVEFRDNYINWEMNVKDHGSAYFRWLASLNLENVLDRLVQGEVFTLVYDHG